MPLPIQNVWNLAKPNLGLLPGDDEPPLWYQFIEERLSQVEQELGDAGPADERTPATPPATTPVQPPTPQPPEQPKETGLTTTNALLIGGGALAVLTLLGGGIALAIYASR